MISNRLRQAPSLWLGLLSFAITAALMLAVAPRARAQSFSDSSTFLKAVKDGDGPKANTVVTQPGSIVVDARDPSTGEGALAMVVKRRDMSWLAFILSKGANINLRDNNGNTPLFDAAQIGFQEGADLLLRVGAGVNIANSRGETPLIVAVQMRDVAMARRLLAAGANPKLSDNVAGMSARDYAARDVRAATILKLIDEAPPPKPVKTMGPNP